MTLRKQGTCDLCGKDLYGDDYGAAGHFCEAYDPIKLANLAVQWIQTKYPADVALVGTIRNPEREADFIEGYLAAIKEATDEQA